MDINTHQHPHAINHAVLRSTASFCNKLFYPYLSFAFFASSWSFRGYRRSGNSWTFSRESRAVGAGCGGFTGHAERFGLATTTRFTLQVDAIKAYLVKQTTAEKSPAASRLPVFNEAVSNYGLDKFADFSDALVSALRVVNQDKILLGQETVHSYFQSGEMFVVTDNEGQITRTITPQEREFEARIAQWLSRPVLYTEPGSVYI
jgi:hypothetical protein